ncbi:MAG: phosphohistidine phosphatase SixA [Verrucomicrobia bacterium]|nr:phosphohistidine phosphatase SixA [Verrucomicrobiota bacterium]
MKLYFLRHATALDGVDDARRPLSDTGRKQVRKLARFLKRSGIVFDAAYTSPLVRARQTAEIVVDIVNESTPLQLAATDALLNDIPADEFDRWLAALPEAGDVLLVGHEPSLSQRVRRMLGVQRVEALPLAKGALACLKTVDRRTAELKFLVTPKSLGV